MITHAVVSVQDTESLLVYCPQHGNMPPIQYPEMHHVLELLVGYHIYQTDGRFPIICPITVPSAIVTFLSWPDDFHLFILFSGWAGSLQGSEVHRRLLEIY